MLIAAPRPWSEDLPPIDMELVASPKSLLVECQPTSVAGLAIDLEPALIQGSRVHTGHVSPVLRSVELQIPRS